jgi:hypothetical protein
MRSTAVLIGAVALTGAAAGACSRAKEVARDLPADARLLGAFDGRVYWAHDETLSWTDDALDAPLSIDEVGVSWATRADFTADATGIYFSHHNRVSHLRRDPSGGGWMSTARELDHPTGAAVDGDIVYTLDLDVECLDRGAVIALSKATGDFLFRRDAPANGGQPVDFAMDASFYYWIDGIGGEMQSSRRDQKVIALPRRSGAPIVIAEHEARPRTDLHVGARGVYWRTSAGIRFAPRRADGFGAPSTLVDSRARAPVRPIGALLVDGGDVFFADAEGVYWLRDGSSEPRRIASQAGVTALVADDRFLYWIDRAANTLLRTRRP